MFKTNLIIGATKYSAGGNIAISRYGNGEIALVILNEFDEPEIKATVALEHAERVAPGKIWLKGWSENEGVPEALEKAGLIKILPYRLNTGHASAVLAQVLPPLAVHIAKAEGISA